LIKFFDIDTILPENAQYEAAELSFYIFDEYKHPESDSQNSTTIGGEKHIYRVSTDWGTTPVNWNTPWTDLGGDYNKEILDTIEDVKKGIWETFDVSNSVKEFIDTPSSNFGFIVLPPMSNPMRENKNRADNHGCVAYSSEYTGDITKRPKLTIYYTEKD
jgi:hypothetical protein